MYIPRKYGTQSTIEDWIEEVLLIEPGLLCCFGVWVWRYKLSGWHY